MHILIKRAGGLRTDFLTLFFFEVLFLVNPEFRFRDLRIERQACYVLTLCWGLLTPAVKPVYVCLVNRIRLHTRSSSFHGAPNENGMIEIGLGIDPKFQNQGYGFEALTGMWGWACSQEGIKTLRYTVSLTNLPSIALVNKFGFTRIGEQLDEIDGPEEIYEMSSAEFARIHLNA